MEKKFLCVMAGYDNDTENYLVSMQNKLYENGYVGTHTKDLPQHITLGIIDSALEENMIQLVKKVAEETKPFAVTFNHIGIFGGSKVLFITPDTNKELLILKENFGGSYNWTPHTTMLIDEPKTVFSALPIIAEEFKAFQGKVENIHLYEFWPTRHIMSLDFSK